MEETRKSLYDELCEILTEYENPEHYNNRTGEAELYEILVKIQNNWENIISSTD